MRKHYPDWLFYILVIAIGGVFILYNVKYGSFGTLSKNNKKAKYFDALYAAQVPIISIVNNNGFYDYTLLQCFVFYLDSLNIYSVETMEVKDKILKHGDPPIQLNNSNFKSGWPGKCLCVLIEYWRKDDDGCLINECRFKTSKELKEENNILKID